MVFSGTFLLLLLVGLLLPATPRAASSLLSSKVDKDSLLRTVPAPRLILVGGSNLSFGIDGKMLQDSLGLRPVNTAIHASLGLRYMLRSVEPHVRPADVVLVVPEYSHYYSSNTNCSPELLRTILDVAPEDIRLLRPEQYPDFIAELPKYALTKFKPGEYFFDPTPTVYSRAAFDEYGDVTLQRRLPPRSVAPKVVAAGEGYNESVLEDMTAFATRIRERGGSVIVSFPGLQEQSFDNLGKRIDRVHRELLNSPLTVAGKPADFQMADSLLFDTPYHLNGKGVAVRTVRLVELLRPLLWRQGISRE